MAADGENKSVAAAFMTPELAQGENKSEVARLRQKFADEYLAAQHGLTGLAAGSARHKFITRKMENMGLCQKELAKLVGDQAATKLLAETLEELP